MRGLRPLFPISTVSTMSKVYTLRHVNSVNSYSAVLPPSLMVSFLVFFVGFLKMMRSLNLCICWFRCYFVCILSTEMTLKKIYCMQTTISRGGFRLHWNAFYDDNKIWGHAPLNSLNSLLFRKNNLPDQCGFQRGGTNERFQEEKQFHSKHQWLSINMIFSSLHISGSFAI